MEMGIPFNDIDEMEWIDYLEYLSVHKILSNRRQMDRYDAAIYPQWKNRDKHYQALANENLMLFGMNPYKPNASAIAETRRKLAEMAKQQKHQEN
jgi:hypothetical protein